MARHLATNPHLAPAELAPGQLYLLRTLATLARVDLHCPKKRCRRARGCVGGPPTCWQQCWDDFRDDLLDPVLRNAAEAKAWHVVDLWSAKADEPLPPPRRRRFPRKTRRAAQDGKPGAKAGLRADQAGLGKAPRQSSR